jgi:hypothetical protein
VINESIAIPPHLSLSARSTAASLFVYGQHAISHTKRTSAKANLEPTNRRRTKQNIKGGHMCPICIASTAAMVAGAGSTGGILAVCIGKLRKSATGPGLIQKKEN